jgi:hypothetical protein
MHTHADTDVTREAAQDAAPLAAIATAQNVCGRLGVDGGEERPTVRNAAAALACEGRSAWRMRDYAPPHATCPTPRASTSPSRGAPSQSRRTKTVLGNPSPGTGPSLRGQPCRPPAPNQRTHTRGRCKADNKGVPCKDSLVSIPGVHSAGRAEIVRGHASHLRALTRYRYRHHIAHLLSRVHYTAESIQHHTTRHNVVECNTKHTFPNLTFPASSFAAAS